MIARQPNKALRHRRERTSMTLLFSSDRASLPPRFRTRKSISVSSLVLAMLATSFSPACAGSWIFHVDGSCTAIGGDGKSGPAWTAPSDSINGTSIGGSSYVYGVGGNTGLTASVNASLNATVTATWTHSTGQTDANDPAPTSVIIAETSSASAIQGLVGYPDTLGTADDSVGDPQDATGLATGPTHYVTKAVSGGSFTIKLALVGKASMASTASSTVSLPYPPGYIHYPGVAHASAGVGPVSLSIHAQPYNWQKTSQTNNQDGTISFTYNWLSTTGNKADLTSCYSHERVNYPGSTGPGSYFPPSCFSLSVGLDNPTVQPPSDTSSMANGTGYDIHHTWAVSPFYIYTTVTATQRYEFNDSVTGETNVLVPGPDSTASIVRTVTNTGTPSPSFINWYYSVSKQGLTAWLQLP